MTIKNFRVKNGLEVGNNTTIHVTANSNGLYGRGSGITALNASNISTGTLNNARLPSSISVTNLSGSGSGITALNASNISTGTLNNSRLPSTISVTSISASTLSGSGSSITALNASNISTGTLNNARLPSSISVTNLAGNGSGITSLNASNISTGTLNSARLPSTINATTVGGNTAATLRSYSDSRAATAYSNAVNYVDSLSLSGGIEGGQNIGTGQGVFSGVSGSNLQFKSLTFVGNASALVGSYGIGSNSTTIIIWTGTNDPGGP